jgi:hypothetical protein
MKADRETPADQLLLWVEFIARDREAMSARDRKPLSAMD